MDGRKEQTGGIFAQNLEIGTSLPFIDEKSIVLFVLEREKIQP